MFVFVLAFKILISFFFLPVQSFFEIVSFYNVGNGGELLYDVVYLKEIHELFGVLK